MSTRDLDLHARRLPALYGEVCARVAVGSAPLLALDFVLLHLPDPDREPRREKFLDIACPWRLETRSSILAGDADPRPYIEAALLALAGSRLNNATIFRPSFTVRLEFDDDLYLWLFPNRSSDFMVEGDGHDVPWYVGGHVFDDDLTLDLG